MWLFNEKVIADEDDIIQKHINSLDTIILKYNQNYLTFEFAALDLTNPEKNMYKYK